MISNLWRGETNQTPDTQEKTDKKRRVEELTDLAEKHWRKINRIENPFSTENIVKKERENKEKINPWRFFTRLNNQEHHINIWDPELIYDTVKKIQKKFGETMYGSLVPDNNELTERLIHDMVLRLFFHEEYHLNYSPDSERDDQLTDKALYEAIGQSEPHLSKGERIKKVGSVKNFASDLIIDTIFHNKANYGRNLEKRIGTVLSDFSLGSGIPANLPDGAHPLFQITNTEAIGGESILFFFCCLHRTN